MVNGIELVGRNTYIVNHLDRKLWNFIKNNRVIGENLIILVSKKCYPKYYDEALYLMCRAGFRVLTVFYEDIIVDSGYCNQAVLVRACNRLSTQYKGKVLTMYGVKGKWNLINITGVNNYLKYSYTEDKYTKINGVILVSNSLSEKERVIFNLLVREGCIGDNIVIFKSREASTHNIDRCATMAKRVGYNVSILVYENFTNAKGNNCIKEAILSYTNHASFCMPRFFLGARGKNGEIQAFSVRDNCLMRYDFSINRWKHC